jgi:hypothetical protein
MTHAFVLLQLDLVHIGGHDYPIVLFGHNATEVANQALLPMCPIVYPDYRKHVMWVFWCVGEMS